LLNELVKRTLQCEWLENAFANLEGVMMSRHSVDDQAGKDVAGVAVRPSFTRSERWRLIEGIAQFSQWRPIAPRSEEIALDPVPTVIPRLVKTARMFEQVAKCDSIRVLKTLRNIAIQPRGDTCIEIQRALGVHLGGDDTDERLRDAGNLKQMARPHCDTALHLCVADRTAILAMRRLDGENRAGHALIV
jgi:hypothetical protein